MSKELDSDVRLEGKESLARPGPGKEPAWVEEGDVMKDSVTARPL